MKDGLSIAGLVLSGTLYAVILEAVQQRWQLVARRCVVCREVHDWGECPVMKETERRRKGEGRNGSRDTREN